MDEFPELTDPKNESSVFPSTMIRQSFPVGPLQCNCSIIGNSITKEAIVVDPGGEADEIFQKTQNMGLKIVQIIHTHAHLDHFLASGKLQKLCGASLALHKEDKPLWDNLESQCLMFNIPYSPVPPPDHWLVHEEELKCLDGKAIHTPGHTPGSMSFWFKKSKLLIAGDTLFRGSIGRTDLWGGDSQKIIQSIKALYQLDDDATVVTGHGPDTKIEDEKRSNPFVNGSS